MLEEWKKQFEDRLWEEDTTETPAPRRWGLLYGRLCWLLVNDLADPQFTLRVMGLVYTTLLSLVPFLALGFSLLKAFGVHNLIEPILANVLQPLGNEAGELTALIIGFVGNVKVGILGTVGLALLLFAAISLIQKVENGFNFIWQVQRSRNLVRRLSEYFTLLTIAPLVMALVVGLSASLMSHRLVQYVLAIEPFGSLVLLSAGILPSVLTCLGFAVIYYIIPNTRVRFVPALVGGLFAGLVWQAASWLFATFASNIGSYSAVYSGFAIVIFLLIWLYVCWMVLLLGCRVAFLLQHTEFLERRQLIKHMGADLQEHLALLIMSLIGRNYIDGRPAWTATALARHTRLPPRHVYRVLELLLQHGFLAETGSPEGHLIPGRDLSSISVEDLLDAVRSSDAELRLDRRGQHPYDQVAALIENLREEQKRHLAGKNLRHLATPAQTENGE